MEYTFFTIRYLNSFYLPVFAFVSIYRLQTPLNTDTFWPFLNIPHYLQDHDDKINFIGLSLIFFMKLLTHISYKFSYSYCPSETCLQEKFPKNILLYHLR